MSVSKPQETWTCDRCGRTIELDVGKQPDWTRYTVTAPPKHDPNDQSQRYDLCGPCDRYIREAIRTPPPQRAGEGEGRG